MRLLTKHQLLFLLLLLGGATTLLVNSCKKDNSDKVDYFLTTGKWQLASMYKQTFIGDVSVDTVIITCSNGQVFTFSSDNKCTYSNYNCITQASAGTWGLSSDNLTLQTTLRADTAASKPAAIFQNAQIINLGQYSLVVQTGDTSPYYTSKTVRVITRFGFVHPSSQ